MTFKVTFCDPLKKNIQELGLISKEKIVDHFKSIDWCSHLAKMEALPDEQIFFSPSLEFENADNKNGLVISAIGLPNEFEFLVFYKRPKKVARFFSLINRLNSNFITEIGQQNEAMVLHYLTALANDDLDLLERAIR